MTPKQRWETAIRMLAVMYGNTVQEGAAIKRQQHSWNRLASAWWDWHEFSARWLAPVGDAMIATASLEHGHRVLDVGCGTGELGYTAAKAGGSVVGIDFADKMVAHAAKRASSREIKNYKSMTAAVSELPFEEHSFDTILARNVVALLPSMKSGFKQMARVLTPGRRLVVSEWGPLERNPWAAVAFDAVRQAGECRLFVETDPGPFRCSDPKTLATLFKEADVHKGYAIAEVTGEVSFNSPEHYWRFLSEVFEPVASALGLAMK